MTTNTLEHEARALGGPAMSTTLTTGTATELADRINAEHRACLAAASDTLAHAMRAGDLLVEAKAGIGYGRWAGWLAKNFAGSARTAQVYMQLASHRAELGAKAQSSAYLPIVGAVKLLAATRDPTLAPADKPQPAKKASARPELDAIDRWLPATACFLTRIVNEYGGWGKLAEREKWSQSDRLMIRGTLGGLSRDFAKCEQELA